MGEIDVSSALDDMEQILRADSESRKARELLGILQRWQWDDMLSPSSRERARTLLEEFRQTIRRV